MSAPVAIVAHEEVRSVAEHDDGRPDPLPPTSRSRAVPLSTRDVPGSVRPMLVPGVRTYSMDGALWLCPLLVPPRVRREATRSVIVRTHREIAVTGDVDTAWRVVARLDGIMRMREIAAELDDVESGFVERLVATLIELEVVDASGRTVRKFLHTATTKPVMPGGAIGGSPDEIIAQTTDGRYRSYADCEQTPLAPGVPGAQLRELRSITHARRSPLEFTGAPIDLETISTVLEAACGVTETVPRGNGHLHLRAYPSGGALYAIETYVHALATPGLEEGLYHYSPVQGVLAHVRVPMARGQLTDVGLAAQRRSIATAGAVVLFAANFLRAERKYGTGGYRVLAIEAGHISESILLCACAAGLQGRPNGGWYEDALNDVLGFTGPHERFIFSLLLGYPAS